MLQSLDLLSTRSASRKHCLYQVGKPSWVFHDTNDYVGMKGLKKVTIHSFNLPSDSPGQIDLTINASIHNPSFVSMEIGDMYFDIIYQNTSVGTLYAPDVTMTNGTPLSSFVDFNIFIATDFLYFM